MAKLHYANLGKEIPEKTMADAFYRLSPIKQYIMRAIETMENLQYKLKWELVLGDKPPEKVDRLSHRPLSQSEKHNHGEITTNRIHIYSDDPLTSQKVFDDFHEAKYILDSSGKQTWKNSIEVLDTEPKENVLVVNRIPKTPHIYLRPNTYGLTRQMRALHFLQHSPRKEYLPLITLTENEYSAKWPQFKKTKILKWEVLTDRSRPGTDLQREFVQIALPTPKTGTPDFAILEGPPGSGKTTAICELVIQAIKRGMRILLCASTHIAVDNVLERLKDRKEIIAVRIGDEGNVKKSVRGLTFQRRKDTERESIINYLNKLGRQRNDSQEYLLKALRSEEGDNVITKIILDSANLVCGTTIGFLQHPDIKAARDPEPLYDLMILDESSKTTFQEFLVPALYAKRWILSGDVKQLSPYVDEKEVEGNIKGLLDKKRRGDGQICLDAFTAQQSYRGRTNNILVVGDSSARDFEKYGAQCRELDLDTVTVTKENYRSMAPSLELLSAQAILVDREIIGEVGKYLPHDVQIIVPQEELPEILRERRQWWDNKFPRLRIRGREQPWHYHLSWRIMRSYELRKTPEEADRYTRDIDKLMPKWYKDEKKDELELGLRSIAQIALPSCLELLQEGFGKSEWEKGMEKEGRSYDYALSTGFPDKALAPRRVMLKYQHRMHPEISEFPRRHIYLDKETGEPEGLHDPDDMRERRVWNYSRYPKRRWWFDIRDCTFGDNKLCVICDRERPDYDNVNNHEADKIIQELANFRKWTKNNPNPENTDWSLTLLTFYRGQERELSRRLQKYFSSSNFRTFTDKKHHLKVEVCTVDRFQGHESDVVFLSFVRNGFRVGFLNSMHRLNVSLTRARYQLVIFGNRKSFVDAYERRHRSKLLHALAKETRSDIRWSG